MSHYPRSIVLKGRAQMTRQIQCSFSPWCRAHWSIQAFLGSEMKVSMLPFLDCSFYRISFLSNILMKYVKLRPLFHKSPVWTSLVGSPIRSTYEMAISKRKDGELRFMRKMTMLEFVFRTPQQLLKNPERQQLTHLF